MSSHILKVNHKSAEAVTKINLYLCGSLWIPKINLYLFGFLPLHREILSEWLQAVHLSAPTLVSTCIPE